MNPPDRLRLSAVSFGLSPEQEQLKAGARGFVAEHLRDLAAAVRAEPDPLTRALLARPVFEKAVGHGFLKGLIPAAVGGAAGSGVDAAIFIEEWAAQSPDFTISFAGPLIALMPVSQPLYPSDAITDEGLESRISELIREAVLEGVEDELPHSIAVTIDDIHHFVFCLDIMACFVNVTAMLSSTRYVT